MQKLIFFLLILILSIQAHAQVSFEEGYYIDNDNREIQCLIKNMDWKNNPTEFEYKISKEDNSKKTTIEKVKEFGIYDDSKYVRKTVNIDRSSDQLNSMSDKEDPIFKEEELFLKVLIEGKANLYSYRDVNLHRFFYDVDKGQTEQLIYKTYRVSSNKTAKNTKFRGQLWDDLKCETLELEALKKLKYRKKDLIKLLEEYNSCAGEGSINYDKKQKRDLFNLTIRPGLSSSSLSIENISSDNKDADFGNKTTFRFGIEAEIIMPFNKNKWAFIFEPTYRYYQSEVALSNQNVKLDYKSIELPLGIRYYFFLNENSKLFINGSYVFEISNNAKVDFDYYQDLDTRTGGNFAFGLGYKQQNKYSIELRYQMDKKILRDHSYWKSNFKTFSVIFGYSIF